VIVSPMLAETGTGSDLKRKDLLFETKLDGVRCIAHLTPLGTRLQGRRGSDITKQFPELAELHRQVKKPCILDGELTSMTFNAI